MTGRQRASVTAGQPAVTLCTMTAGELDAFIREEIADGARARGAEDGVAYDDGDDERNGSVAASPADELPPEALAQAERDLATIIRWEREATSAPEQRLLTARTATGQTVGWLWLKLPPPGRWDGSAFLCQMTVAHGVRRQGYGRAMLTALEQELAAQGFTELRLNVWEENEVARALYASAGYTLVQQCETLRQLRKDLTPAAPARSDTAAA